MAHDDAVTQRGIDFHTDNLELGYVGDSITQRDIFETDPGGFPSGPVVEVSETQGIGSLPDDFELGYVGDFPTQRDIFETHPVVSGNIHRPQFPQTMTTAT